MPHLNKQARKEYNKIYYKKQKLSPEVEILSPEFLSPKFLSPEFLSPEVEILSPEVEILSPEVEILSPEVEILSPKVEILSPHFKMRWAKCLARVHREFYKSAWFGRWKYQLLICHAELKDVLM